MSDRSRMVIFTAVDTGKRFAKPVGDVETAEEHTDLTTKLQLYSSGFRDSNKTIVVQGNITDVVREINIAKAASQ